ncbi:hypothetical protein MOF38_14450 [Bacillus haynesii]|uniref:hypothetical protein n=1 Tax=Bacillus haynesii TaxID=1925021 RepID=UPI00228225A2|nr:hypothetical protein [Bacillus haynesii]MCY8008779.1 hypothetical protein [Bacillus haynesii]MCY9400980.1 hypothetical protein [Bacillus haynesii]
MNDAAQKNFDGLSSISTLSENDNQSLSNEEFDFLIEDPVFQQLEQVLAEQEVKDAEIKPMWVPIVATALRVLISKVSRSGMKELGNRETICRKSLKSAEQI